MNITLTLIDELCAQAYIVGRFIKEHPATFDSDTFTDVREQAVSFVVHEYCRGFDPVYDDLFDATMAEMKRRESEASRL